MMKRRKRPEQEIQRAVCQQLAQRGVPGLVWFAVPNGGRRDAAEAANLKRLGVRPGVSDLIFLHSGRAYALELKSDEGRPTESQMHFISDWNAQGGFAAIANGVDRAIRALEAWRLLKGSMA